MNNGSLLLSSSAQQEVRQLASDPGTICLKSEEDHHHHHHHHHAHHHHHQPTSSPTGQLTPYQDDTTTTTPYIHDTPQGSTVLLSTTSDYTVPTTRASPSGSPPTYLESHNFRDLRTSSSAVDAYGSLVTQNNNSESHVEQSLFDRQRRSLSPPDAKRSKLTHEVLLDDRVSMRGPHHSTTTTSTTTPPIYMEPPLLTGSNSDTSDHTTRKTTTNNNSTTNTTTSVPSSQLSPYPGGSHDFSCSRAQMVNATLSQIRRVLDSYIAQQNLLMSQLQDSATGGVLSLDDLLFILKQQSRIFDQQGIQHAMTSEHLELLRASILGRPNSTMMVGGGMPSSPTGDEDDLTTTATSTSSSNESTTPCNIRQMTPCSDSGGLLINGGGDSSNNPPTGSSNLVIGGGLISSNHASRFMTNENNAPSDDPCFVSRSISQDAYASQEVYEGGAPSNLRGGVVDQGGVVVSHQSPHLSYAPRGVASSLNDVNVCRSLAPSSMGDGPHDDEDEDGMEGASSRAHYMRGNVSATGGSPMKYAMGDGVPTSYESNSQQMAWLTALLAEGRGGGGGSPMSSNGDPMGNDGSTGGASKRARAHTKQHIANTSHRCSLCSGNKTPQWRYVQYRRYCNACYMRIKRHLANKGIALQGTRKSSEPTAVAVASVAAGGGGSQFASPSLLCGSPCAFNDASPSTSSDSPKVAASDLMSNVHDDQQQGMGHYSNSPYHHHHVYPPTCVGNPNGRLVDDTSLGVSQGVSGGNSGMVDHSSSSSCRPTRQQYGGSPSIGSGTAPEIYQSSPNGSGSGVSSSATYDMRGGRGAPPPFKPTSSSSRMTIFSECDTSDAFSVQSPSSDQGSLIFSGTSVGDGWKNHHHHHHHNPSSSNPYCSDPLTTFMKEQPDSDNNSNSGNNTSSPKSHVVVPYSSLLGGGADHHRSPIEDDSMPDTAGPYSLSNYCKTQADSSGAVSVERQQHPVSPQHIHGMGVASPPNTSSGNTSSSSYYYVEYQQRGPAAPGTTSHHPSDSAGAAGGSLWPYESFSTFDSYTHNSGNARVAFSSSLHRNKFPQQSSTTPGLPSSTVAAASPSSVSPSPTHLYARANQAHDPQELVWRVDNMFSEQGGHDKVSESGGPSSTG